MLLGNQFHLVPQQTFDIPPIEETGATFHENALLKAKTVFDITGLPVIGDDSGLEVVALDNQPGVYSSRFAGADASDDENIDKLLREMHKVYGKKRKAIFRCVVAYLGAKGVDQPIFFKGEWKGYIAQERVGKNGFGYDPIFIPNGYNKTFSEMEPKLKMSIDHRFKAYLKIKKFFI